MLFRFVRKSGVSTCVSTRAKFMVIYNRLSTFNEDMFIETLRAIYSIQEYFIQCQHLQIFENLRLFTQRAGTFYLVKTQFQHSKLAILRRAQESIKSYMDPTKFVVGAH